MATVPIPMMVAATPMITVIVVPMPVFMRAIVTSAFFDCTPGCKQQTGQAE